MRKLKNSWMKVIASVLFYFAVMFQFAPPFAYAVGVAGAQAGTVTDTTYTVSPWPSRSIDDDGTVWNNVNDVYKRIFIRNQTISYNATVTETTGTATNSNNGWTIAIPTAAVNGGRRRVTLYNPVSNTQNVLVNFATGPVSGGLSFPTTNYAVITLKPGDAPYSMDISSFIHPVIIATGTFANEKVTATEWNN